MRFLIGGIKRTSLIDFPNKISAIIFTQGCNFNCGFCHNPMLLRYINQDVNKNYSIESFFDFLNTRKGKLEGVVISGGEPTLQPDLKQVIIKIKEMGFGVKLDTNGTNPNILKELFNENLLDYIAMDIKAPLSKYSFVTNTEVNTNKIKDSIYLIKNSNIDYEFRTTFLPYYHDIDDFDNIGKLIKGAKRYYLQRFESKAELNCEELRNEKNFSDTEIQKIMNILKSYVISVELR